MAVRYMHYKQPGCLAKWEYHTGLCTSWTEIHAFLFHQFSPTNTKDAHYQEMIQPQVLLLRPTHTIKVRQEMENLEKKKKERKTAKHLFKLVFRAKNKWPAV